MAWNGTVTCSECYRTGHNKNGCPQRKERYQEALAMPEEERGWRERRVIQDFEDKKLRSTTRKCSYCGTSGHNRRKCEQLAEHSGYVQRQQVAFRAAFLEHLRDVGLNTGCLVKGTGDYVNNNPLSIVMEIHWDTVTVTRCGNGINRFIVARPLTEIGNARSYESYTLNRPDHWPVGEDFPAQENCWQEKSYAGKVVGPCEEPVNPPEGWLIDEKAVKEFFKERESWQWPTENSASTYHSCNWWNLEENQELKKTA